MPALEILINLLTSR